MLERRLVDQIERVVLADAEDMARLLPDGLPEQFTTEDLAVTLRRQRRLAQHLAHCLSKVGVIEASASAPEPVTGPKG